MLKKIVILCGLSAYVWASCPDPSQWMDAMNDRVITVIDGDDSDAVKAEKIATIFKPNLNIDMFTKKIVGRTHWQQATAQERAELQKKLYRVMLKEYTESMVQTLSKKPEVYRVRAGGVDNLTTVTVAFHTQREKILLANFSLQCMNSQWKIYDIMVSGVRLSDLQQEKFKEILKNRGISGLNDYLTH